MAIYFIEKNRFEELIISWVSDYDVFVPFERNQQLFYELLLPNNTENFSAGLVRPVQPLKFFFNPFQERVVPEIEVKEKRIIIGAANCDLKGLKILDRVFIEGDYKDPNYEKRRKNTFIVSIDCTQPLSVCFCKTLGINPYPDSGFDLNLTKLENGFLIETGSENGVKLIEKFALKPSSESLISEREKIRNQSSAVILKHNEQFHIPSNITEIFHKLFFHKNWEEVWKTCVQCGSCTNICPSCVCFFLEDISKKDGFMKSKIWDSCLLPGYARMASGVSPRPLLAERYRNRLACKYQYMVENFKMIGCTGCGRCIAGCPGKIDKRKVLSSIFEDKVMDVRYESLKYL